MMHKMSAFQVFALSNNLINHGNDIITYKRSKCSVLIFIA
jgi:hypothetical protein